MTTLQERMRQRMLRWLSENDPGGEYSDAEADANGWPRLTLAQAHELVRDVSESAMARDRERLARVLWRLELRAERQAACRWCGGLARLLGHPIVRGGQGRTAESLRRDAAGVVWTLTLAALVIVLLVLASCRGGAL